MARLVCEKCGTDIPMPMHCGREMHQEGKKLVCWMGKNCGQQDIPKHCGVTMKVVS